MADVNAWNRSSLVAISVAASFFTSGSYVLREEVLSEPDALFSAQLHEIPYDLEADHLALDKIWRHWFDETRSLTFLLFMFCA